LLSRSSNVFRNVSRSRPSSGGAALFLLLAPVLAPVLVLTTSAGCGGPKTTDGAAGSPAAASAKDGASDAGAASAADAAPAPRPFAGSAAEATQLIGAAVDKKAAEVQKCVVEYRTRKNLPRERVSIQLGIDQEGRLLGATLPKGKTDAPLSECVQRALADAPFPRSHTGVISITKSYEEIVQ
jgi:hypothetical protein